MLGLDDLGPQAQKGSVQPRTPEGEKARESLSLFQVYKGESPYFICAILNDMFVKVLLPTSITKGPVMSFMALL